MGVRRLLVEKKEPFNVEASQLKADLLNNFKLPNLEAVRIINVYDVELTNDGTAEEDLAAAKKIVFSEPNVDTIKEGDFNPSANELAFRVQPLPGQYDQRADSANQCYGIVSLKPAPKIESSKIYVLSGIGAKQLEEVKKYLINPVEARETPLRKPGTIIVDYPEPSSIKKNDNFIYFNREELLSFKESMGLSITIEDLRHIQVYFLEEEKRNPTETEIKVIDTYWSDHCRHTTFLTEIERIDIEDSVYTTPVKKALEMYLEDNKKVSKKPVSLMDLATISMKKAISEGNLDNLDLSKEINACSIVIPVNIDGKKVSYILQFKNESHSHPTEIEPKGGAATCIGGAIRDVLAGRAYVYQAMRVTGSGNPLRPIKGTLKGKLPQQVITTKAARGFSSYGNQVGVATGLVDEVYHEGFVAKRMEIGAVIGAAPKANIVRKEPEKGDMVLLVGGRTGRDGVGGATGSSKSHTESSLETCGAEVQKGNAPEERKLQNLFRIPEAARMIKRCNDFGAGGVSVAIGELAPSLEIDLDQVPKKYEGLNGTELALSESQERMAVVVDASNVELFSKYCSEQNVECTPVARVTDTGRLIMKWQGEEILNIKRSFLDTNGAKQTINVRVKAPAIVKGSVIDKTMTFKEILPTQLADLNVCSKQGLGEQFDSTVGGNTVLMPFGGKYYKTPIQAMVAKIPVLEGDTTTCSMMSYGYDPEVGTWSPFHGAVDSIVDSITKIVITGGNYTDIRLSLQEYFEKLGDDPQKWGKPFSAMLGAYYAQQELGISAIGGKDSMSGTFEDISVPPTVISFAVAPSDIKNIISPELKQTDSDLYYFDNIRNDEGMPDFEKLQEVYTEIHQKIKEGQVLSAYAVGKGGVVTSLSKMAFGNKIGVKINNNVKLDELFATNYGSIVLEVKKGVKDLSSNFTHIGKTNKSNTIAYNNESLDIDECIHHWEKTLQPIFPIVAGKKNIGGKEPSNIEYEQKSSLRSSNLQHKPTVFIPIFPGTNCEVETKRAFEKAGAKVKTLLFRNLTPSDVKESMAEMTKLIGESQIICIPGGFSAGDEPDGTGKFIVSVFRNPEIADKTMELLKIKDGLMLGICNGFQALIKLGLLPYGEIRDLSLNSPTLTYNSIGRHISAIVSTKVVSSNSPWLNSLKPGDIFKVPVSHGEGRFYAEEEIINQLFRQGQIATQYVDLVGKPTYNPHYNLNGSLHAVEGILSPDGRVFGKMGHIERLSPDLYANIPDIGETPIIYDGVNYYVGRNTIGETTTALVKKRRN